MKQVTIALSKGYLLKDSLELLKKCGVDVGVIDLNSRQLIFEDSQYKFLLVRPSDVPVYVDEGVADIGISGLDIIKESAFDIPIIADLGFGYCEMVMAVPASSKITSIAELKPFSRVATKFVNIAEQYLNENCVQVEIVKLYGSIEIAPLVGLADAIIDLTATGQTLIENNLKIIETISPVTAHLIANSNSLRVKHVQLNPLIAKLESLNLSQKKLSKK